MGMLGALAGAGQAVQGYAQSMKDTQKMNWMAKQDQVKHERAMNLENLRASRTSEENQLNRDANTANAEANRTFQTSEREAGEVAMSERYTQARKDKAGDAERGVDLELEKQEKLLTMAKEFTETERNEKADALQDIWGKDGMSPTEEVKIAAMRAGIDMTDITGSSKPMTAEMVKNLDGMLSEDEAYQNANPQQKISILRDAYQSLGSGGGQRMLSEDALARAKANKDSLTEEDLAQIPPIQLKEIFGSVEAAKPTRVPTPGRTQGQQYQDQVVGDMSLTKGVKSGYSALKSRFANLREGK